MSDTRHYFDPDEETHAGVAVTLADGEGPHVGEAPVRPGEVLGRYVVMEELGRGGMGVVVSAYDATLDRRVALKLLHARGSDPDNHARMLREAQSLAKLSHPGVVSVYDVGELRGQVFIAMEYIDGPNLRRWLKETPRKTAEVLAVYRDAARGLQAAHDAEIVHRDFKPDNVLIGSNGRACVTDFGLALDALTAATIIPTGVPNVAVSDRLTEAGMVMGTPAYMSIEQHAGKPTDHRSDQFSFCVSMYESLYGVRPFSGTNGTEYCASIKRGNVPPPPSSVKVPRRVHRALVRGLSARPEDRFPSMRAFLRAITPPTRKSRNWVIGGVGGLVVGAGLVAVTEPAKRPCSAFDDRIETVYSADHRKRMRDAFVATELPYASSTFAEVERTLDGFADRWVESATEACMASERGEQSERMLDMRMHCLDQGLFSLSAMTEVLIDIEGGEVEGAPDLVGRLPDLQLCSDLETLPSLTILPETPEQRRDAENLLPVLERVGTLVLVDRLDEAAELIGEHATAFEASTYPPVRALATGWRGRIHFERAEFREARGLMEEAHLLSLEHGLDMQATRTAVALGALHSATDEHALSLRWYDAARALARATGSKRVEATVLTSTSSVLAKLGRLDEAVEASGTALELIDDDPTYPPRARIELLLVHAAALYARDGGEAGLGLVEEAQSLAIALAPDSPVRMKLESELSERAALGGNWEAALEHASEAVRVARVTFGPNNLRYGVTLSNMAYPLKELGRLDEALARYEEAADVFERTQASTYNRALLLVNIANVGLSQDRRPQVREQLEKLSAMIDAHGFDKREAAVVADLLWNRLLIREGEYTAARDHARHALDVCGVIFGEDHFRTTDSWTALAWAQLEQGEFDAARESIDRARRQEIKVAADRARASFVLARVLWESPSSTDADQARALELARSAQRDLARSPSYPYMANLVKTWLTKHDAPHG